MSDGDATAWVRRAHSERLDPELSGSSKVSKQARKEAIIMPMGQERTKEELYRAAKRLNIKGRSKMNKGQLKAALARRGH